MNILNSDDEEESSSSHNNYDTDDTEPSKTNSDVANSTLSKDDAAKPLKTPLTVETLKGKQVPRYYSMVHRYGDQTLNLIGHVKKTGPSSWNEICSKSERVNKCTGNDLLHVKAVTDAFELNVAVAVEEIVPIVCELRSRFNLEPFTNNINGSCINELRGVFIVEETMQAKPDRKGNQRVYTPIFQILAD